jgi:putative zinc finger/helix-turn-helix YgiT family protein
MSEVIKELPFPWPCSKCHQQTVERGTQPYSTDVQYDGRTHTVEVPEFHVPRCKNCGAIVLDDQANDQITDALRRQVGLLTPAQIRNNRDSLGLKQRDFATLLGVGESTVSRWETGSQIQQKSLDKLMRIYFAIPEVRDALADKDGLLELGTSVVKEPEFRPEEVSRRVVRRWSCTSSRDFPHGYATFLRSLDEPSSGEETRHYGFWKAYTHLLEYKEYKPTRPRLALTDKFYSCVLRSFREERKKPDPANFFLENIFSSRHDALDAWREVSPDVANLLPLVSCWAVLTDSSARTQWRTLFERAVETLSDVSAGKSGREEDWGRWFVAPLRSVQRSDLEQSAKLSRLASRLDILTEAKRESALLQYEKLTELMVP